MYIRNTGFYKLKNKFKISIAGSGYVGMSLGVLLAQNNKVSIYDINENRVNRVNNKQSTVLDSEIEKFLQTKLQKAKITSLTKLFMLSKSMNK